MGQVVEIVPMAQNRLGDPAGPALRSPRLNSGGSTPSSKSYLSTTCARFGPCSSALSLGSPGASARKGRPDAPPLAREPTAARAKAAWPDIGSLPPLCDPRRATSVKAPAPRTAIVAATAQIAGAADGSRGAFG